MSVCCLGTSGAWAGQVEALGIPVAVLDRQPGFQPALGLKLAAFAAARQSTVLHCHHYSPFVYASLARIRKPPLRVLYTEHGRLDNGPPSRKRRLANRLLGQLPYGVYAVSDNLRGHMRDEGFAGRDVRVIRNGITLQPAPTPDDAEQLRRECDLSGAGPVIGTVGRLDPVKGFDVLISAFAMLRERFPGVRLVIVGDGPDRDRLTRLVDAAGCRDAVKFLGYRSDARRIIGVMDVYVNSSLFEGISLTILEAMSAGKPVVATAVGGNAEVVRDGVTGLLVPASDAGALAAALEDVCANADKAAGFGERGRLDVEQQFTIERMVEAYALEYERAGA